MSFFNKRKICVTHDGTFHSDDLFATAVLYILNDGNIQIIRTRDQSIIESGDFVYDVGGQYDSEKNLFDHHQKGGAGIRENGIPYSSFGLVWKKFGEQISGDKDISDMIDKKLVQPIDAIDNGVDIVTPIFKGIFFYGADQVFLNHKPTWKEGEENINSIFREQMKEVVKLIKREIEVAKSDIEARNIILDNYNKSEDKRIIYLENSFPRYLYQKILSGLPEPIYVVMPSGHSEHWKGEAISISPETMESRKLFPETWRGLSGEDSKLKEISGVPDAVFCHKSGFLLGSKSRSGAIELVKKAIIA